MQVQQQQQQKRSMLTEINWLGFGSLKHFYYQCLHIPTTTIRKNPPDKTRSETEHQHVMLIYQENENQRFLAI